MQSNVRNVLLAISGLSTLVVAQQPLATVTPCPSCPTTITLAPVIVTAQYQPVATCSAVEECNSSSCSKVASCSTYDWVSTVIPYLAGASTTTVTETEQIVQLAHVSTVHTSYVPCPTTAPIYQNATRSACSSAVYQTEIVDYSAAYNECGPLAVPGWGGSGLCKKCLVTEDKKDQKVHVNKCLDGKCTKYDETWVSLKPKPTPYTSYSVAPVSTVTYCPSAGVYTIPIVTTCTPHGPSFTKPVPTTVYHTTTVTGGPQYITCVQTVTITFTRTVTIGGPVTVIGGTTVRPTGPYPTSVTTTTTSVTTTTTTSVGSTGATGSASSTTSGVVSTSTDGDGGVTATSSTISSTATATPTGGVEVAEWEFVGCLGSSNGFSSFSLQLQSAAMDVDVCTAECETSGFTYSGLYLTECYCAAAIDDASSGTDLANGVCNLPCPGDASQTCGGNQNVLRRVAKRQTNRNAILLDVYSYSPTSTSSSATETGTETSATAEPSSDPDPAPERRSLNADMETSNKVREIKLRSGGLLRNAKSQPAPRLAKRDYAVKKIFGQ